MQVKLIRNEPLAQDMVCLTLQCEPGLDIPPGTFAHVAVPGGSELPLRRPISVMGYKRATGALTLGIRVVGEGTRRICAAEVGTILDILAPLGRGFEAGGARDITLVGGGVGVAPLLHAAEAFGAQARIEAFLGFRSAAHAYGVSPLREAGARVAVSTDDGSMGKRGLVTTLLEQRVRAEKPSLILACGPVPMLKAVQRIALDMDIPCQLSVEERMGCGVGACLVCACAVRSEEGAVEYKRACADGPVFDAKCVVL